MRRRFRVIRTDNLCGAIVWARDGMDAIRVAQRIAPYMRCEAKDGRVAGYRVDEVGGESE